MVSLLRASGGLSLRNHAYAPRTIRFISTSLVRWQKQPAGSQLDPMTGELTALPDIDGDTGKGVSRASITYYAMHVRDLSIFRHRLDDAGVVVVGHAARCASGASSAAVGGSLVVLGCLLGHWRRRRPVEGLEVTRHDGGESGLRDDEEVEEGDGRVHDEQRIEGCLERI